jgi:hypothetical protein
MLNRHHRRVADTTTASPGKTSRQLQKTRNEAKAQDLGVDRKTLYGETFALLNRMTVMVWQQVTNGTFHEWEERAGLQFSRAFIMRY